MSFYICSNCGYGSATFVGRCPDCQQWSTMKRQSGATPGATTNSRKSSENETLTTVDLSTIEIKEKGARVETGIFEFDRVLGGGFVKGEFVMLTGEPGVGKSTLLLQSVKNLNCLYVSGEESAQQVKERALRVGLNLKKFFFSDSLQIEGIIEGVKEMKVKPDIIVIDSIQTVYTRMIEGTPGSVSQMREVAMSFMRFCKTNHIPLVIIGHVTKEGDMAGPKTVEHMVDAVMQFEGERISNFRILRVSKNRFGSTDEIGIFEMTGEGLKEVNDPLNFLSSTKGNSAGKVIAGVMEGKRPLFVEIQALASPTSLAIPRRIARGIDYNKLLLILAVIRKQLNIHIDQFDVYVNVVGGMDLKSPMADLAIAGAIISSVADKAFSSKMVLTGEVGLLGEVRGNYSTERVINEATRLGLTCKKIEALKSLHQSLT